MTHDRTTSLIISSKGVDHICQYDVSDQELIEKYRWHLNGQGYASTLIEGKQVMMHRLILGIVDQPDIEVDHIHHNKLDNRRAMIRTCSRAENSRNRIKKRGYSKFKGVYRENYLWHSQICFNQKVLNLGRYRSELTAAKAYDRAARLMFGEFSNPNFNVPDPLPAQMKLAI